MTKFSLDDLFDDSPKDESSVAVLQDGSPAPAEELQPINVLAEPAAQSETAEWFKKADDDSDDDIDVDDQDDETENLAGVKIADTSAKELTVQEKREKLISEMFEQNDYIRTCEGDVESAKENLKEAKDQLEKATSRLRVLVKSLQNFDGKESLPLFDNIDSDGENGGDQPADQPEVAESVTDSPAEYQVSETTVESSGDSPVAATTENALTYSDFPDDSPVETLQSILGCSDSQIAKFNAKGYYTLENLIVALKHEDEQENIDVLTQVEGVGKAKAKKYLEVILARKAEKNE